MANHGCCIQLGSQVCHESVDLVRFSSWSTTRIERWHAGEGPPLLAGRDRDVFFRLSRPISAKPSPPSTESGPQREKLDLED